MALKFLGRIGPEHYVEMVGDSAVNRERPMQQFKAGVMPIRVTGEQGMLLRVSDIGEVVAPAGGWKNEDAVLAAYPGHFAKVDDAAPALMIAEAVKV